MAPHPLRIAHENLARELDAGILSSKANGNFRNAEAISQSVDRFVNEFCRSPDSTDELKRRATLVADSCAQGTEFRGRMNQAFQCLRLSSVPLAGPGISGRKLAIRNFQPVADLEFGSDLDRKVIQPIIRADRESVIPVRCQQLIYDLLDECRRIKHEADHLEADGCLYLRRIGSENHSAATGIDRHTAIILKTNFGMAMLEPMRAAADSLVALVESNSDWNSDELDGLTLATEIGSQLIACEEKTGEARTRALLEQVRSWLDTSRANGGPTKDQLKFMNYVVDQGGKVEHADISTACGFDYEDPRDGCRKMVGRIAKRVETAGQTWGILAEDQGKVAIITYDL